MVRRTLYLRVYSGEEIPFTGVRRPGPQNELPRVHQCLSRHDGEAPESRTGRSHLSGDQHFLQGLSLGDHVAEYLVHACVYLSRQPPPFLHRRHGPLL
ncbi:MAG: hypothetical protein ACYC66_10785 [Chloroflexota bacterium]